MAVSLSGNDEVHSPEVLALDHQGAPRSRQSQLLHGGNMVVQYLQRKKTIAHRHNLKALSNLTLPESRNVRNASSESLRLHT